MREPAGRDFKDSQNKLCMKNSLDKKGVSQAKKVQESFARIANSSNFQRLENEHHHQGIEKRSCEEMPRSSCEKR